jgi:hypothetical protein
MYGQCLQWYPSPSWSCLWPLAYYYYGSYIGENGVIDLMGCSHVGDHGDGRSVNLTVAVGKRNSKSAYVVACVTPHPLRTQEISETRMS